MSRGGARLNAGAKPTWKHGKTKTIRVPIILADLISEFARNLDEVGITDPDTQSKIKVLELSNVSIKQVNGYMYLLLSDLLKQGYTLKPKKLHERVSFEVSKLSVDSHLSKSNY